jgi:signal peptidase I
MTDDEEAGRAPESAAAPSAANRSEADASEAGPSAAAPSEVSRPGTARTAVDPEPRTMRERYAAHRRRRRAARTAKKHRKAPWWELPALVVLAIAIAILVKTFIVQPFYIPSESMEKTLHGCQGCHGDRILVNKIIYDFRDPHPGDIVVFHAPPGWDEEPTSKPPSNPVLRVIRGFGQLIGFVPPDGQVLVKRVIAVGGQTVKGDAAGHVWVADSRGGPFRRLTEPYVYLDSGAASQPTDQDSHNNLGPFGPVTVPKGRLWVMGDHRSDSADSRYHCGGSWLNCDATSSTVPVSEVIGKAFVIAWPPSRWRTLGTPPTFEHAALATAADLPGMAAAGVVLPLFGVRRRRRSRRAAAR